MALSMPLGVMPAPKTVGKSRASKKSLKVYFGSLALSEVRTLSPLEVRASVLVSEANSPILHKDKQQLNNQ